MAMARRFFDTQGCLVETAVNVVRWIAPKEPGGPRMPISTRHDFFGVWDAIVIDATKPPVRTTFFIQVTSVENMSARRRKILDSGFPCGRADLVMGYRGGGRFRVLRGPTFELEAEEWKAPPPLRKSAMVPEEGSEDDW